MLGGLGCWSAMLLGSCHLSVSAVRTSQVTWRPSQSPLATPVLLLLVTLVFKTLPGSFVPGTCLPVCLYFFVCGDKELGTLGYPGTQFVDPSASC